MSAIGRTWDSLIAVTLALLGAYFLPANALRNLTTELIAFFSIQTAVILPAMIFTAGILRPDGLELKDAMRYHNALKRQMQFWVVLLALDFIAVFSLILGKAVGWTVSVTLFDFIDPIDLSWSLCFTLYFAGGLAFLRTIPFVRGVMSLLDLNSDITTKVIKRRNKLQTEEKQSTADQKQTATPEDYGKIVEHNGD